MSVIMMKIIRQLVSAILAGVMISLGGTVFLASESRAVGAIFFSLGLTVILLYGLLLFTGKTAYLLENRPSYIPYLLLIWVGNLIGTLLTGLMVGYAKPALAQTAEQLCTAKLAQSPWQTLALGALCGVLVYIAVDYFRSDKDKKAFSKYLLVFTCVPVFILCGFEHSVADMFYFAASSSHLLLSVSGIVYILLVSAGNLVGAVVFHTVRRFALK